MKRSIVNVFLITVCMFLFSSVSAKCSEFIGDIEIFKDCSASIPPNVLFLMDTSASMVKMDYMYLLGADEFSKEGDWSSYKPSWHAVEIENSERLYTWSAGNVWTPLCGNKTVEDVECPDIKHLLEAQGYYRGKAGGDICSVECSNTQLNVEWNIATGRYANYMFYLGEYKKSITYENSGYDYTHDYGADGFDDVKLGSPRPRNRLYYNDGMSILPLCLKVTMELSDIRCIVGDSCNLLTKKAELTRNGFARDVYISPCIGTPGLAPYFLYTGNFMNYMELRFGRRYAAIRAMKKAIKENPDLRYGIMQFDLNRLPSIDGATLWRNEGGDLALPCGDKDDVYTYNGESKTHAEMLDIILDGANTRPPRTGGDGAEEEGDDEGLLHPVKQYMYPLYFASCVGNACENKMTPLAESLVEAGLYFAGEDSWFNSYAAANPYVSPIQCPEQKNFVVILTDGKPRLDFLLGNPIDTSALGLWTEKQFPLSTGDEIIGDSDGDREDKWREGYIDDVAKFLHDNDLNGSMDGDQNIVIFPIGLDLQFTEIELDHDLMQDTADNGQGFTPGSENGVYARAKSEAELQEALDKILLITDNFTFTFSSAATPISIADSIYSSDDVFTTGFQLKAGHRGEGNITKYVRDGYQIQGKSAGTLTDLFDSSGGVVTGVVDLWAPSNPDCSNNSVPCMGAAYMLKNTLDGVTVDANSIDNTLANVAAARTLKTAHGSETSWTTVGLTDSAVIGTSPSIEINKEGDETYSGDELKQFLVRKVYGLGLDWPLGDILHSNLIVAQYPDSDDRASTVTSYIFSGHNDGMLHCFDASDGSEVWGFIPPDIFKDRLNDLKSPAVGNWFVDGGMVLYYSTERPLGADYDIKKPKYLVFGERRGGTSYHVLNVSTKDSPDYEFQIGGATGWGQSWSLPELCQVKTSSGDSPPIEGVLVGGGYDINQDKLYPGVDSDGKFVSIYGFAGAELKRFPQADRADRVTIDACVVGASIIDHDHDDERLFDRIYAGDLQGNVYHFADDLEKTTVVGLDPGGDVGYKIESDSVDGSWYEHHLFEAQSFRVQYQNEDGTSALATVYQKIFYAPIMGYACAQTMVFFGTGDREHPFRKDMTDSIYAVNDNWLGGPYDSDDLMQFNLTPGPSGSVANGITRETYTVTDCKDSCSEGDTSCNDGCSQKNKGWYFDFPSDHEGEKLISEPLIVGNHMIFGAYTPPVFTDTPVDICAASGCTPGEGRIYVVNTCVDAFAVTSYKLPQNPMPQPSLVFDKNTGKVLINTGSGQIIDPELPVVVPDYWKHSGSAL